MPLALRELLRYPLVFLTGHLPGALHRCAERATLAEFLQRAAACCSWTTTTTISGRRVPYRGGGGIGRAIAPLQELSNDHALLRSFFTCDGPPTTGHELNGWGQHRAPAPAGGAA